MAHNRVTVFVSPTAVEFKPSFGHSCEAGFDPFKIGVNWDGNTGPDAWERVVIRNFTVTATPGQLEFTAGKNTVGQVEFDPVITDTDVKYDVVFVKGSRQFTIDPTLVLKPGF